MKQLTNVLLILIMLAVPAYAQRSGVVSGLVRDANTRYELYPVDALRFGNSVASKQFAPLFTPRIF